MYHANDEMMFNNQNWAQIFLYDKNFGILSSCLLFICLAWTLSLGFANYITHFAVIFSFNKMS